MLKQKKTNINGLVIGLPISFKVGVNEHIGVVASFENGTRKVLVQSLDDMRAYSVSYDRRLDFIKRPGDVHDMYLVDFVAIKQHILKKGMPPISKMMMATKATVEQAMLIPT